nr:IclR family transcriptional regulator [Sulfoacidibacillus thermotolerans]
MVGSLTDMGLLQKEDGKYRLGLTFLQFGLLVSERLDVRKVALPLMYSLRDEVGEAVNLIVRDRDEAIYVEKVDTEQPVRVYTQTGRRAPMYAGACPRILLAFLPFQEQEQYVGNVELKPLAKGTITDRAVLRSVLSESRIKGYSISHSELENDTSAVAAPIFDHRGMVIAGLSIAGPTTRFDEERVWTLVERVVFYAHECSTRLGYNA